MRGGGCGVITRSQTGGCRHALPTAGAALRRSLVGVFGMHCWTRLKRSLRQITVHHAKALLRSQTVGLAVAEDLSLPHAKAVPTMQACAVHLCHRSPRRCRACLAPMAIAAPSPSAPRARSVLECGGKL